MTLFLAYPPISFPAQLDKVVAHPIAGSLAVV
jgi:hypothetical protein